MHFSNREVLALATHPGTSSIVSGSLRYDSLSRELSSSDQATLSHADIERVFTVESREVESIKVVDRTSWYITPVVATGLITGAGIVTVLRTGEGLSIVPAVSRCHSLL